MNLVKLASIVFLLSGCAIKVGRVYKEPKVMICSPCLEVGEKGKSFGFVWFQ